MSRWELLELAKQTMEGKFGNGEKRRALLGGRYKAVQSVVDYILRLEDERHRKAEEMEGRVRSFIGGTKNVQASKVPTFTGCQSYRFEVLISDEFEECASKDLMKARLMDLLSEEIDKQLEAK